MDVELGSGKQGEGLEYDCWSLRSTDQFAAVDHLAQALADPKMRHVVSLVLRLETPKQQIVQLRTPYDSLKPSSGQSHN